MRLAELVHGFPLTPVVPGDPEISGVQHDSRRVRPGDLFVAIRGARADGLHFVPQALENGAVAIVAARPPVDDSPAAWLVAAEPRAVLGRLAARAYGHPDRELITIGVTGTNGKSTCVWLLQSVLETAGVPTGNLGTVPTSFRDVPLATARTTPEAPELFHLLRQLRDRGAAAAAMEVSSHSLVLGRVTEMRYDVAVFTHLTRDHLDFHGTMERYFEAKCRIFELLKPGGTAVVNVADPWGRRLLGRLPRLVSFGAGGDVAVTRAELGLGKTHAVVRTPRGALEIESSMSGEYNLQNMLAVIAASEALGLPHEAVHRGIANLRAVPGRMERVEAGQPFPVFLDYAHTDDALRQLYTTVRQLTGRRIVAVFGVQGERDPGKRPLMGAVAGELADAVVLTSDNPRSEDPAAIIEQLAEGVVHAGRAQLFKEVDRAAALRLAMRLADGNAVVLVTGKGNETGQEVDGVTLPFSDREEIERAVAELEQTAAG